MIYKNTVDSLVNVSLADIVNTHHLFNNYQESCTKCALTECRALSPVCLYVDLNLYMPHAPPYV